MSRTDAPVSAGVPTGTGAHGQVTIRNVSKVFGHGDHAVQALDRVDLTVKPGEFVCLIGASGCGKSTLLNLVTGLDQPTSGEISVEGRTALMFQESALMPWLTVIDNVALPLRMAGVGKKERVERAHDLLAAVRLDGFGDKRPHELSGGMRQRVALARSFAQEAEIVCMDEPFGALDAMTRDLLHDELERLWTERKFTTLFVTHNVREAARLGNRVVLLSSRPGRVVEKVDVDMPHPRQMSDPEVVALSSELTEKLRQEVRRHAAA